MPAQTTPDTPWWDATRHADRRPLLVARNRIQAAIRGWLAAQLVSMAIIGVLNNGMILTAVPTFYQMLAKGTLLILAVLLAEYRLNRS